MARLDRCPRRGSGIHASQTAPPELPRIVPSVIFDLLVIHTIVLAMAGTPNVPRAGVLQPILLAIT
jgi:hypothetical protein